MLSISGPSASRASFIPAWNISTQRYQTRSIAFSIGLPFVELPELVFLSLPNISLPALSCTSFPPLLISSHQALGDSSGLLLVAAAIFFLLGEALIPESDCLGMNLSFPI